MRGVLKMAVLGAAAVMISGTAQAAVDEIVLGSLLQPVTFSGIGSPDSVSVALGNCSGSGCSLSGLGAGWAGSWNAGTWTISTPAASTITLTDDGTNDGLWSVSGPQLTFSYGFPGTVLLAGAINLATVQISPTTGIDFKGNTLTGTSGTLANEFVSGSRIEWQVLSAPSLDLYTLLDNKNKLTAYAVTGEIVPTPEPGTLFLIGSGLILAGGILRRRVRSSATNG